MVEEGSTSGARGLLEVVILDDGFVALVRVKPFLYVCEARMCACRAPSCAGTPSESE